MPNSTRDPWNKGRHVGPRQSLSISEVGALQELLKLKQSTHDLCLFTVAIDTMLRVSDLTQLKVSDIVDSDGEVVDQFHWRQKKTSGNVSPALTQTTRAATKRWLVESGKLPDHALFTRTKPVDAAPITEGFCRQLIKEWVTEIGLASGRYSAHSLRRTKAQFMYERGVSIEIIGLLLGHRNTASTVRYLGIDQAAAQQAALRCDIFRGKA